MSAFKSHFIGGLILGSIGLFILGVWGGLFLPLIYSAVRELGQHKQWWGYHDPQSIYTSLVDINQYMLGGYVAILLSLLIQYVY